MEETLLNGQNRPGPWAFTLDVPPCSDNLCRVVECHLEAFHPVTLVSKVPLGVCMERGSRTAEWGIMARRVQEGDRVTRSGAESLSCVLRCFSPGLQHSDKCLLAYCPSLAFSGLGVLHR